MGPTSNKPRKRPWSVTAVGLFGLGAIHFAIVYLVDLWAPLTALRAEELFLGVANKVVMSIIFIPLSLLAILAAVGFRRLWCNAWTNAMLLQGLTLLIALILYFTAKPLYVYILMLYSIFMVLYLNYYPVQMAFRPEPGVESREGAYQGDEGCQGDR